MAATNNSSIVDATRVMQRAKQKLTPKELPTKRVKRMIFASETFETDGITQRTG